MKLKTLEATFLKYTPEEGRDIFAMVDTLAEADGIKFLCPKCLSQNNGTVGTHMVICWFAGKVPDSLHPNPGRWTPQGTCIEDITFVPGNPPKSVSVLLIGKGCGWHGFVKNGEATLN